MINNETRFEKYGNVMIDIETLSTCLNAVIIEISAVEFNKDSGDIGEIFHKKISSGSWMKQNRDINVSTIKWWMSQSEEARENFCSDKDSCFDLESALYLLSKFINECDNYFYDGKNDKRSVTVWGNGSIFDIGILQHAYETAGIQVPWKFWAVNDVRTIVALNPSVKYNSKFNGTQHCSTDDCLHEIKYLVDTLRTLVVKNDKSPRYLDIILPKELIYNDVCGFPYEISLLPLDSDKVKIRIDLLEKKMINWDEKYGDCSFFVKATDNGQYIILDDNKTELYSLSGYVPNTVIPPIDGFGDYIEFNILKDGSITDLYDFDKLEFSKFTSQLPTS